MVALLELREELDVRVTAVSQEEFAIVDPGSPFLIAFVRVVVDGEPVAREHLALHWGTLLDIQQMALAPSDGRYVEWRLAEMRAG